MTTNKPLFSAIAAMFLISAPASSHDDHRELGAHEHGRGTLNIAIEGEQVSMELEVPGMNIVGFEHAPSTAEQKAKVASAQKTLESPLALFKLSDPAGCTVKSANVAIESEHDGDHGHGGAANTAKAEDDDHDKDHDHYDHADRNHGDGDHDDHDDHAGHNAYRVTYTLACSSPDKLSAIDFGYFKTFPGAQRLTVNVVTPKAQSTYEVARDKPVLDLGGVM